ncbi:MAG: hypothetical protein WCK34_03970, partial [Bacteroidota bacterium]
GTNLFYYSLWQPTMSHLYSFFLINGFLWISLESLRNWNAGRAFTMGILLGLILLTRPTNIIVIMLIPFLAGDRTTLRCFLSDLRAKPKAALVFSITFAALCAIQAAAWYVQTGRLLLWSYGHEGFHLASPAIYSVLFSFRKGLFIYTPLVLVSLTGLILLFLKNKMQFFTISGFLIVATWIIAGWWNWYYGDGFGLRAFVDYYGVFAILLALVMNMFHTRAGIAAMLAMLIPFVVLNLVQTWQYTHRVIQPNSMNLEKYRYVLMRTDSAAINCLGGVREIADYGTDLAHPVKLLFNDFETTPGNWSTFTQVKTGSAYSGKTAGYLDPEHQFSSGVAIRASGLGRLPASFFVAGEIMVRDSVAGASNRSLVVLSMDSIRPGENWWQGFLLNDTPQNTAGKWRRCTFSLMTPEIANPGGLLKIYIWNTGRKPVLVDDFAVRIYGKGR